MGQSISRWTALPSMTKSRESFAAAAVNGKVYVVGGLGEGDELDSIECYDVCERRWISLASKMSMERSGCAAAAISGNIYVAGGYDVDCGLESETVESYNIEIGTWTTTCPSMRTKRQGCAGVAVGNEFFVFGGFNRSEFLNTAEVFNVKTRQWKDLAPMNSRRGHCAAAAIGNRIYVVGGKDDKSGFVTVEIFDTTTRTWTELPHRMQSKRIGCAAVAIGNHLIVAGGHDEVYHAMKSVEVYDVSMETWMYLPLMTRERSLFAAVVLGEAVFVMGGTDDSGWVDSVEQLDFSDKAVRGMLQQWSGGSWSSEIAPLLHWHASIVHSMDIHLSVIPALLSRVGHERRTQTIFGIVRGEMSIFEHSTAEAG